MSQRITVSQYQILEELSLSSYRFNKDQNFNRNIDRLRSFKLIRKRPLSLTELGRNWLAEYGYVKSGTKKYRGEILDLEINQAKIKDFKYGKRIADFEVDLATSLIERSGVKQSSLILDPFCGMGTTNLACMKLGYENVGLDVNPVMIWGNRVKFDPRIKISKVIAEYEKIVIKFLSLSVCEKIKARKNFNLKLLKNREKWFCQRDFWDLSYLYYLSSEIKDIRIEKLFKFLVGKIALQKSNLNFCPGVSFYHNQDKTSVLEVWQSIICEYIKDKQNLNNSKIQTNFRLMSARDQKMVRDFKESVDLILSSPPYPNNLDYVLINKLELYLHGFCSGQEDLTKLRKKMINSNPKMNYYKNDKSEIEKLEIVKNLQKEIELKMENKNWGFQYGKMIGSYFSQMNEVLGNFKQILNKKGQCILVISDQNILGVKIRTAEILGEMAGRIGFRKVQINEGEKRNERVLWLRK